MGVLLSVLGCFWVRFGRFGVVAGGDLGQFFGGGFLAGKFPPIIVAITPC